MIDCNEWRTEKRHECANMGKVKRLELWWQLYRTSLPVWGLENFRPMDFCWQEFTYIVCCITFKCSAHSRMSPFLKFSGSACNISKLFLCPLYLNELSYKGHATGSHILLPTFYFPAVGNNKMAGARVYGFEVTLGTLKWYETKRKGTVVRCRSWMHTGGVEV